MLKFKQRKQKTKIHVCQCEVKGFSLLCSKLFRCNPMRKLLLNFWLRERACSLPQMTECPRGNCRGTSDSGSGGRGDGSSGGSRPSLESWEVLLWQCEDKLLDYPWPVTWIFPQITQNPRAIH